ncbi:MAG: Na+-dependent transporter [Ignavibacteria bacterium]
MESFVMLSIKLAVGLIMFSLGLNSVMRDAIYLIHNPKLLLKSIISMNLIMPLIAVIMIFTFGLKEEVKLALFAIAISPIPPLLPNKALKAGGKISYTVSLLLIMALLSIIFIPLSVELMGIAILKDLYVSPLVVIEVMGITLIGPLVIGLIINKAVPLFAQKIKKIISITAVILLIAGVIPLLIKLMPVVITLFGNLTLVSILIFIFTGLIVGHLLGGPVEDDRTVLALTTSTRHPGIAIVICLTVMPEQKLAVAVILLYLLINVIVSLPYIKWRKKTS